MGAHDDLVMSLALANAATQAPAENFILIDDMDLFDTRPATPRIVSGGILGLNL